MRKIPLVLLVVLLAGCKGPAGSAGPQGNTGAPGAGLPTYSMTFMYGAFPNSGYTAPVMAAPNAVNPNTFYTNWGDLVFAPTTAGATRIVNKWPIKGFIPSNATVVAASIQLVNKISNVNTRVMGMHKMTVDTGFPWTSAITWNSPDNSANWSAINGSAATFTAGNDFDATPLSAVTMAASTPPYTRYAWSLPPSLVQTWVNPADPDTNGGVVFISEAEGTGEASGSVTFGTHADTDAYKPQLVVQYTLP